MFVKFNQIISFIACSAGSHAQQNKDQVSSTTPHYYLQDCSISCYSVAQDSTSSETIVYMTQQCRQNGRMKPCVNIHSMFSSAEHVMQLELYLESNPHQFVMTHENTRLFCCYEPINTIMSHVLFALLWNTIQYYDHITYLILFQ